MTHSVASKKLTEEQNQALRRVVALVRAHGGRRTEALPDGGEAYAYPHPDGGVAWVFNGDGGHCVDRGIWIAPAGLRITAEIAPAGMTITVADNRLIIRFEKRIEEPITWIGLDRENAIELATTILRRAKELE